MYSDPKCTVSPVPYIGAQDSHCEAKTVKQSYLPGLLWTCKDIYILYILFHSHNTSIILIKLSYQIITLSLTNMNIFLQMSKKMYLKLPSNLYVIKTNNYFLKFIIHFFQGASGSHNQCVAVHCFNDC